MLAARFRRPWPIVLGILASTLLNHAGAAAVGAWLNNLVGPAWMARAVGVSFLAMAAWILVPDKIDEGETASRSSHGVFLTTALLFFAAEMGDKTQVATVVLAARYDSLVSVVAGTTLGMMIANVPVVFFGEALARRMPVAIVRKVTAVAFAILGVAALVTA